MKIVPLNPTQVAEVSQMKAEYAAALQAHQAAYKNLLNLLQQISGVQAEAGRKTRLALSDDLQHIVVG